MEMKRIRIEVGYAGGIKYRAVARKELQVISQRRKLAELPDCVNRKDMELHAHVL